MEKKRLQELLMLRSIACLSIVLLHAMNHSLQAITGEIAYIIYESVHLILYYGTPLFVFISEFLLAYAYRDRKLSKSFWKKRVHYIAIPYVCMALFYAIPYATSLESFSAKLLLNIVLGDFHGYFILIIFQFYVLHVLLSRQLEKWKPRYVLVAAFLLNIGYLTFFNLTTPADIPFATYIWERAFWVPFIGWSFYFVLGFYCGRYYEDFLRLLSKYKYVVMAAPVVSTLLLLFFQYLDVVTVYSSKRPDMVIHGTAIIFFVVYVARQIRQVPSILLSINRYSFGIYLLHMFYISLIDWFFPISDVQYVLLNIVMLFSLSIILSMFTIWYLNSWNVGKFIVGKLENSNKQPWLPQKVIYSTKQL